MKMRFCPWLILLALLLVSAAPRQTVEELLRLGNEAFHNQEYREALDWYAKAEERSTDPGQVAYNKALALYQLGQFREAELHFRRALEGAAGPRRAQALYGLGNSLLIQARDTDVRLLLDAIKCYQLCRSDKGTDALLGAQVNHNLELARLLLIQARARAAQQPQQPDGPSSSKSKPDGSQEPNGSKKGSNSDDPNNVDPAKDQKQITDGDFKKGKNQKTLPMAGKPPVIPDEETLVPLPPEDTAAYLQQLTERLLQQQQQSQANHKAAAQGVKDW